jgi:hypothetical protein
MAATVAEVDSMAASDATARRDLAGLAAIRTRSRTVVRAALAAVERSGVRATIGSRRDADTWLALATAHRDRLEGRDDPAAWDRLAHAWQALACPYEVAKARWRQAEAILGGGEGRAARGPARTALTEAATIGLELSARPLLREVRQLANRAMIRLPAAVDALLDVPSPAAGSGSDGVGSGSPAQDGLDGHDGPTGPLVAVGPGQGSAVAAGKDGANGSGSATATGHEPSAVVRGVVGPAPVAVGVHVGNILAKLRVSGRVEAAAVAIRLGLTESIAAGSSSGR